MGLGDVDLNLLVTLDALLAERNVTRAGRRLGLTQPTTSRALARLRRLLDDPLLVRVGREMQLTPRAEQLGPQVREILRLAERAIHDSPHFDPATDQREFTVSCSDYVTLVLMCRVVGHLGREAPNATLHLVPRVSDAPALLRNGDVDLVIEPRALMRTEGLSHAALFSDEWACAMWSGADHTTGRFDARRFEKASYLTYTLGAARVRNLADRLLAEQGLERMPAVTTDNFALVPFLLRGTNHVSLVLRRGVMAFGSDLEVTLRDAPIELPTLVETMYWNPRNDGDAAHRWLRSSIVGIAAEL